MEQLKLLRQLCALHQTKGVGVKSARALVEFFGDVASIFDHDNWAKAQEENPKLFALRDELMRSFVSSDCQVGAQLEMEFIKRKKIKLIEIGGNEFPELLAQSSDAPLSLMVRGSIPKSPYWISIVGTRRATALGLDFCRSIICELAPLNPVIVSGLAKGIDYCAHQTALELGLPTVACLAHGLNQIYPKEHYSIAQKIEKNGALITEFWSQSPFHASNFLQRNRIIAGLSHATLVIESGVKGGSLITAQFANGYDREVFAMPGNPYQKTHQGCNELIKTHQAHMITETADLIRIMGWTQCEQSSGLTVDLDPTQRAILERVHRQPYIHKDELSRDLKLNAGVLQGALLNLELFGLLLTQSGCCLLSNRGVRALD
jgi:DNA processing protein